MARSLLFILLFCTVSYAVEAQLKNGPFVLSGSINSHVEGTMILMPVNDTSYYRGFSCPYTSEVRQGKFEFSGSVRYPTAFRIGFKPDSNWAYISAIFFIDSGSQSISCNVDSLRSMPVISNRSMKELTDSVIPVFKGIWKQWDDYYDGKRELRRNFEKEMPKRLLDSLDLVKNKLGCREDSILEAYVKRHTKSFVALWESIAEFSSGYSKSFDTIYECFSPELRNSAAGVAFARRLGSARLACTGCIFPKVSLVGRLHPDRPSPISAVYSKYTLVDFWFSHCAPCIEQFPVYSSIYESFSGKGFQIIGISTDKQNQIGDWKAVIRDHALKWPQFLDVDGLFAGKLSILMWPSNFLLDQKGKVLIRNVDPLQLEQFLKANL